MQSYAEDCWRITTGRRVHMRLNRAVGNVTVDPQKVRVRRARAFGVVVSIRSLWERLL